WTAKTFLYQARNPSAVIQVRVRQNDRINITRRNGSGLPVALAPFLRSLKKATVDQNLESLLAARIIGCVDQVLGAGHGAGCSEKLDVEQEAPPEKKKSTAPGQRSEVRGQIAEVRTKLFRKSVGIKLGLSAILVLLL